MYLKFQHNSLIVLFQLKITTNYNINIYTDSIPTNNVSHLNILFRITTRNLVCIL